MRTTLTLDPDVAAMVRSEMHRRRAPLKQIVNDALRRGLARGDERRKKQKPFKVIVHHAKLAPGIDPMSLNKLADALEDEAILAKFMKARK